MVYSFFNNYDIFLLIFCFCFTDCKVKKKTKKMCVFQISQPYLGFCSDPKHFIVKYEQNIVRYAEKKVENVVKNEFLYKIFW